MLGSIFFLRLDHKDRFKPLLLSQIKQNLRVSIISEAFSLVCTICIQGTMYAQYIHNFIDLSLISGTLFRRLKALPLIQTIIIIYFCCWEVAEDLFTFKFSSNSSECLFYNSPVFLCTEIYPQFKS